MITVLVMAGRDGSMIQERQVLSGALRGAQTNSFYLVLTVFAGFAGCGSNIPRIHVS